MGKRSEPSLPSYCPAKPSLGLSISKWSCIGGFSRAQAGSVRGNSPHYAKSSSPTNSSPEKEEKKKWKDLKIMKKLERQRAQEEQAKRQEEEEEAAAQRSNQGKQLGLERTQVVACSRPAQRTCFQLRPLEHFLEFCLSFNFLVETCPYFPIISDTC